MKVTKCAERISILSAFCAATVIALPAQTFTVIERFNGTNGGTPAAPLIEGIDANLYGTTGSGGVNSRGTIFKLTPTGKLTTLYNFCMSANCLDGSSPIAGLVQGDNNKLYGTTQVGGAFGVGTIFQITPKGKLTTVYHFCEMADCVDGAQPISGLVEGFDGIFYGTALDGGANGNHGTVFAFTASRNSIGFHPLHSFCIDEICSDGSGPRGVLTQGADGSLYGTTESFGANSRGTVFKITPQGALTTLYNFCASTGCPDGDGPAAGVIQGADGNFYGTTAFGGTSASCTSGCGTFFRITPGGTLTTLHSFTSSDGAIPVGLLQATDGNFYGTTEEGGLHNNGTIFRLTPGGALTTLHTFAGRDGVHPVAGLMQATGGDFWGTTELGGLNNNGTVFRLSVGLGAFVKTFPVAAHPADGVLIVGQSLTGATKVTFNGVPADVLVVSATRIVTHVPSGATTGPVQVTTPGGTLTSNVAFQVLP